jgi:hypothetical protein
MTNTAIPLNEADPAVLAASFAVQLVDSGPVVTGIHVVALASYLQSQGFAGAQLAALTGRGYDVLVQEFSKALH